MNLVINLNKPKGISSQQAVTQIKKILGAKKAGHAGTLDPIATGVLLVCTSEATKITRFLSDLDKEYIALMKLGERTNTLDSEGKVMQKVDRFSFEKRLIEQVLDGFRGTIEQTPPMFSAVKLGGEPLYKLARKGVVIERPVRSVNIYGIEITGFDPPFLEIRVSCSKGTYVRTLCDDIGDVLGVGAHITELKRTRIGGFRIEDSTTMDELARIVQSSGSGVHSGNPAMSSIDSALMHLRGLVLTDIELIRARNGMPFIRPCLQDFSEDEYVRLKDQSGNLFAIGKVSDNTVKIERILSNLQY